MAGYLAEVAEVRHMLDSPLRRYQERPGENPSTARRLSNVSGARARSAAPLSRDRLTSLHPEAYTDLDDIWEFIAEDNLSAGRPEIYKAIGRLVPFPHQGHRRPDLTSRPFAVHNRARLSARLRSARTPAAR